MQVLLNERKNYIDSLKGISILAVTFIHTGGATLPGIYGKIGSAAARGVEMFFIISGFLTFCSAARWFKKRSHVTCRTVFAWYLRKVIRLLPMWYLMLIVSVFGGFVSEYWLGNEGHVTIYNILAHVFFVHAFFPHYINSLPGAEWYLGVLVIFIFLTPFLYKYIDSCGKCLLLMLIVYILKPMMTKELLVLLPMESDPVIYNTYVYGFNPLTRLLVYLMGGLLFYMTEEVQIKFSNTNQKCLMSCVILSIAIIMLIGQILNKNNLYNISGIEMYGLWCMIILISQIIYAVPIINNVFFSICGKYSYGMYLFQYILIPFYFRHSGLFMLFSRKLSKDGELDVLINFVVCTLALLFISIIVTKYVDVPIQKRLNSLYGSKLRKDLKV